MMTPRRTKPTASEQPAQQLDDPTNDSDIDYSDIPELDKDVWEKAKPVMSQAKKRITMWVDQDVLDFFRRGGPGYQTRINAVLRAFVDAQRAKKA